MEMRPTTRGTWLSKMQGMTLLASCVGATILLAAPVQAAPMMYQAVLAPLNNSGVTGLATLSVDGSQLSVRIQASGLTPNQLHIQHIHGVFDDAGRPANSVTPTIAQDADGDGFVEVLEAAGSYGPILLNLDSPAGSGQFPMAPGGIEDFTQIYDLTDDSLFFNPLTGVKYTSADIFPLTDREIVIHGLNLDSTTGLGFGEGEADGTAGYKAVLPVAAGEITAVPVPEPASLALFGAGLLGLTAVRRWGTRRSDA